MKLEELFQLSQHTTQQEILKALKLSCLADRQFLFSVALGYILKKDQGVYTDREPIKSVGWLILKSLDQKELVDEGILADLLAAANCEGQNLDHTEIPKIIEWICSNQHKDFKMAVKQHVTEIVEDKPSDSSQLSHLVRILELLRSSNQVPTGPSLVTLCETVVRSLSGVVIARNAEEIKLIKADVPKFQDFFRFICESRAENYHLIVSSCLKILYQIITAEPEPSQMVSITLQIVDDNLIGSAVLWILNQAENKSDVAIKKGFSRLCNWSRQNICTPSLHLWILEILNQLMNQKRYEILVKMALENVRSLFISLIIPINRERLAPIVFLMLGSVRHTSEVFDKIVDRIIPTLEHLRNLKEHTDDSDKSSPTEVYDTLLAIVSHLMKQFHLNDNQFLEQKKYFADNHLSSSNKMWMYLSGPAWHEGMNMQQQQLLVMPSSKNPRVGLLNLGNTCYMNSVLQALVMTKQFSREILMAQCDSMLLSKMQSLIGLLLHSKRPELNPREILKVARPPGFLPGYQQDSSEFLGYLLDKLHEQEKKITIGDIEESKSIKSEESANEEKMGRDATNLKKYLNREDLSSEGIELELAMPDHSYCDKNFKHLTDDEDEGPVNFVDDAIEGADFAGNLKAANYPIFQQNKIIDNTSMLNSTLIQKIFGGKISTSYQCLSCGSKSINIDAFRDLQLSFPEQSSINGDCKNEDDSNVDATNYSVQTLLDFYCSSEKLVEENQYFCDQCKQLCDGERSISIMQPPKNLILTLKHFRYDQRYHTRAKLLHNVYHDEEINLNIRSSTSNQVYKVKYVIYAAVVHSGVNMDSGHYFTYACNDDNWFKFNDSYVTKTSSRELHNLSSPNTPYILFYEMVSSSSSQTASSTLTSASQLSSPSKLSNNNEDSEGSIIKKQCLIGEESNKLPEFEELSPQLRDEIRNDNKSFANEQGKQPIRNAVFRSQPISKKNPNSRDSDSDDNSPSCNDNPISYCNNFIF